MKANKLIIILAVMMAGTLIFSCGDSKTPTSGTTPAGTPIAEESAQYTGKIAFIRMDSLMTGYGMYIDMFDEFQKKGQDVESQLSYRGRALEREAMAYQEKVQKGLVTRFEAQTLGEELQKKEQSLLEYRDKMMGELQSEEFKISAQISEAIFEYIKEYNAEKGYSMILQTTAGNPIILADPAYDITKEILEGLNKRYLDNKGTSKKKAEIEKEGESVAK